MIKDVSIHYQNCDSQYGESCSGHIRSAAHNIHK